MSFFLHPANGQALWHGLFALLIWVWGVCDTLWRRWFLPAKKEKLLAKNPSFAADIDQLFSIYQKECFSNLFKAVALSWLLFALIMTARGYVANTDYDELTCRALYSVLAAALILTGLHGWINSHLLDAVYIIKDANPKRLDIEAIRNLHPRSFVSGLFGLLLIAAAVGILSCTLFKYPVDLYQITLDAKS